MTYPDHIQHLIRQAYDQRGEDVVSDVGGDCSVIADWLEESGQSEQADALRAQGTRWRTMRRLLRAVRSPAQAAEIEGLREHERERLKRDEKARSLLTSRRAARIARAS